MGQKVSRNDFDWSYTDEPHATRRKIILEIKTLMGHDPLLKWSVLFLVTFQILSLFIVQKINPLIGILMAYFIGGVINHALTLAIHEISHNLAFSSKNPLRNRILGYFANLPIDHHKYQGDTELDVDLPCELEAKLFNRTVTKFLWIMLQPFFYAIRPLLVRPLPLTKLEIINILVQLIFDAWIVYFFGWKCLIYLIGGTLLAMGLHPVAGHFISEHYMFKKGYETYSYYGVLNAVTYNVGYHNEHHDFPNIPGSKLPLVRKMAPEFYDNLPSHNSWIQVLYDFVMDPEIGPYARIKRTIKN